MKATKAFYKTSQYIAEYENFIEESQEFIRANKGNAKEKEKVQALKEEVKFKKQLLVPLYAIRNAFY